MTRAGGHIDPAIFDSGTPARPRNPANATFDMNCVGHIQHGMWTHPRDRSIEYNTIRYWQDLARLAERGKFDGIFLADIIGVYDVNRGGPAPSIIDAVQKATATA